MIIVAVFSCLPKINRMQSPKIFQLSQTSLEIIVEMNWKIQQTISGDGRRKRRDLIIMSSCLGIPHSIPRYAWIWCTGSGDILFSCAGKDSSGISHEEKFNPSIKLHVISVYFKENRFQAWIKIRRSTVEYSLQSYPSLHYLTRVTRKDQNISIRCCIMRVAFKILISSCLKIDFSM